MNRNKYSAMRLENIINKIHNSLDVFYLNDNIKRIYYSIIIFYFFVQ